MLDDSKQSLYGGAWHGREPYDRKERVRLEKACRIILRHAAALGRPRMELLDFGCGVGPLREWLPPERFRIIGLEISPQAAELARKNYDACAVADAENPWPFEPASFDAVHAGAILEHVLDWHAPLNNANRVLRNGGLLVAASPNLRYWKEIRRLIRGRQPHWLTCMGHVHGYTPRFLRTLLEMHGFEVFGVEADRVNLPLLPDSPWLCRRLAGIGSVLILAGRLARRVRVEDDTYADRFPGHKPLPLRSIEVPLE